jgi:ATP-dependent DNA ligase
MFSARRERGGRSAREAVLDGEIVILAPMAPDFQAL